MFKDRKARTEAKRRLAEELGVSVSLVNKRKMVENGLISTKNRLEKAENARKHRENCEKLAKQALKGQISPKEAAYTLGITERQFQRWVSKIRPTLGTGEEDV